MEKNGSGGGASFSALWRRLLGWAPAPTPGWQAAGLLWSLAFTLGGSFCVGLLSLYFGAGEFKLELYNSYFRIPHLAALNLLPVLLLALLFWFLFGRAGPSLIATSAVVMGFTLVSALKVALRGTPLMWEDLQLAGEALKISGLYALNLSRGQWLAIGLCALAAAAAFLLARARLTRWPVRLGGAAACAAVLTALFFTVYQDTALYNATNNDSLINRWSETQVYQSRGFVYPFLYSSLAARDDPPEGYDEARAQAVLAAYQEAPLPEEEKVSVMAVMLEAYSDLSDFPGLRGRKEVEEVYALWRRLEEESWSGQLLTNSFGGGTVLTERAFLTGFSRLGSFRAPSNSYVRWFTDQGYAAVGGHPNNNWFYNRANVNLNLGFDEYRFLEDYYGWLGDDFQRVRDSDADFFPDLLAWLRETDGPCFQFSVSYQNHGPYDSEVSEERVLPTETSWSDSTVNILNNYLAGIRRTNRAIATLTDGLRALDRPVVLVLFGDHKPWMGDENSVPRELGVNMDVSTLMGFYNYYATPYVIWANDAAKAALGRDFIGDGPDLSPCFLMNELFDQCGWTGPAFMQAANALKERVPVLHETGLYLEDGRLTDQLTPARQALFDTYDEVQYDWRKNFSG